MTYGLSDSKLYRVRRLLAAFFELPHKEGSFHYQVAQDLPQWAAEHLASTGFLPQEFVAPLEAESDRAESFVVVHKEEGPGLMVVFYRPADWIH